MVTFEELDSIYKNLKKITNPHILDTAFMAHYFFLHGGKNKVYFDMLLRSIMVTLEHDGYTREEFIKTLDKLVDVQKTLNILNNVPE